MISELEYSGPPPSDEPHCEVHGCAIVRGRCPQCAAEERADDPEE